MVDFTGVWVDKAGNSVADLVGWEKARDRITWNAGSDNHVSMDLTLRGGLPDPVNPVRHRLQVYADGVPYVRLMPSKLATKTVRTNRTLTLPLVGLRRILGLAPVGAPYTAAKGVVVTTRIKAILDNLGEARVQVTPHSAGLPKPIVWESGTTIMKILGDLADRISYWAPQVDALGGFVVAPYVLPDKRPIRHEFIAGQGSLMVGEYDAEEDLLSVPNRLRVYSPPYGKQTKAITAEATNRNKNSRYSYDNRQFWVYETVQGEYATQAAAQTAANKLLAERTSQHLVRSVKHLWVPGLGLHDAVKAQTAAGDSIYATVQSMTVNAVNGFTEATWREVVALV